MLNTVTIVLGTVATIACIFGYIFALNPDHKYISLWVYGVAACLYVLAACWGIQQSWINSDIRPEDGVNKKLGEEKKAENPQATLMPIIDTKELARAISPLPTTAIPPTSLTANQIIQEIRKARPFQKDDVAKSFAKAPVNWIMSLSSISKQKQRLPDTDTEAEAEMMTIQLFEPTDGCVMFSVPIAGNEYLSLLDSGTLLRVMGQIEQTNGLWVILKNVKLEIA